jgi:predicted outer membrane repeat protein
MLSFATMLDKLQRSRSYKIKKGGAVYAPKCAIKNDPENRPSIYT